MLVGMYQDGKTDMKPHMPTAPENLDERAAVELRVLGRPRLPSSNERFNAWLAS